MSKPFSIDFSEFSTPHKGILILLVALDGKVSSQAEAIGGTALISRLMEISGFKGKFCDMVQTIIPTQTGFDRIALVGVGDPVKLSNDDWIKIGGIAFSMAGNAAEMSIILSLPETIEISPTNAGDCALGMLLRSYTFDKYKTRKNEKEGADQKNGEKITKITLQVIDPFAAKKSFADAEAILGGVRLARDLVNEPANVLGPLEFVQEVIKLENLNVKVEIFNEQDMRMLSMGALLGVAQGSSRPPRLAIMQWNGSESKNKPIVFIGKGVVFDTGGISIKPSSGMEEMKGDMGGAAAVTGLIHTLAARKAKINAIGLIGLVENMPDGNAQRPGDIVTSMSGQTIEIINTDAEGRLVLADMLWYANDRFKPRLMINLATLTGAVIVALGQHHAGLFSNDDDLAAGLYAAGQSTGEKLWRMPLGIEYDKMIDSKFADMKNAGDRYGGAITAAQFLKRFVGDTPWAHLDVAGTIINSPSSEYNQSWTSGFGVRLLDRFIRDRFED